MNKTVPWSIKGVGPDTREAAKEAARRSGVSLGEWLDGIIAERASRLGVPSVEVDSQERQDAVADELSRLAARSTAPESGEEVRETAPAETGRDPEWAAMPQARFAGLPPEALRSRDMSAGEARAFDSAATSVEQPFFGNREPVPNVLQASQGRGSVDSRVRAAVNGSLAERLDFEEEPSTQRALRALSEKLESFERQNWAGVVRHAAEGPERTMGEAGPLLIRKPGSAISAIKERSIRYAVAEIARRQAALYDEDRVPPLSLLPGTSPVEKAAEKPTEGKLSGASLGALDQAVASIEAKLTSDRLAADAERRTPSVPVKVPDGDDDSMAVFAALGRDLRQAIGSEEAPTAPMSQAPVPNDADSVGGAPDAVAEAVRAAGARPRRELRDRPASASDGAYAPDRTGEQHASPKTLLPADPGSGDLLEAQTTLSEIRALLDRFEPGSAISSLERRMEDLATKIDRGMEPQSSSKQIEDLARQIDEIHSSIQGQIGSQAVEPSSVDALVRGIAERIEEAREASADIERLESLIKGLAAKIDGNNAQPDPQAVTGLEAQMSRLGERLERSEASLSALDGVEHSLGELFTQLEETRHAAIDAAENAARTAARDTLRAAMQNPAMPQGAAEGESGLFGQVAHELAELRVSHDQTSRRTQTTLAGLNQTMERLVEHLARLDATGLSGDAAERPAALSAEGAGERRKSIMAPSVRAELGLPERRKSSEVERPADTVDPIDTLIEPGLGRASIRDRSGKADAAPAGDGEGPAFFIAAARRAAHAAQASAAATSKPSGRVRVSGEVDSMTEMSALERARNFLRERRRPLLLGLAGLVLLLGALEAAKLGVSGTLAPEHTGAAQPATPAVEQAALQPPAADVATPAPSPAPDAGTAGATAASPKDEPASASTPAAAAASGPSAETPAAVMPPAAAITGSIAAPAASAAKAPVAVRNMNPFLPGNDFKLGGLSEGLRNVALAGDPAAQYEVGLRFAEGRTVNRDPKVAASWFEKAAVQGFAPAQYRLGSAYEKGIGEPKNPALALTWYGRAADAGNMRAMHNLAVMAAEGAVGKPDYAKAAGWFEKAAALGVRDSQFNLAILYARGLGIELNLAKSYTWFAVAASQGDDDAGKKRDEVGARLDAKTLADAKAAAEAFRPSTAVSAANEVSPPPGGWDAAAPSRSIPSAAKTMPPRFTVM